MIQIMMIHNFNENFSNIFQHYVIIKIINNQ
jgi:hypothetical protein